MTYVGIYKKIRLLALTVVFLQGQKSISRSLFKYCFYKSFAQEQYKQIK